VTVTRTASKRRDHAEFVVRADVRGQPTRESRFVYKPLPTPRDSLRSLLLPLLTNDRRRAAAARALEMPEFLPPVTHAYVDDAGRVWLRREAFQSAGSDWLVLDQQLSLLGTFHLSAGVQPQRATHGYLWTVEESAFGEPIIVAYGFPFSAGAFR
jgi:hypothetical protein